MKNLLQWALICLCASAFGQHIGDGPVIREHLKQEDINDNDETWNKLIEAGEKLFLAKFNTFDGQGRPGTTGTGNPREPGSAPAFIRTSAPESNSCAGCHNDPFPGGGGDIVANAFVLAQALDPVTDSVSGEFSNERNTLGMFGAGPIEMLAREMTAELHAIRDEALARAKTNNSIEVRNLVVKGVNFGRITVTNDGTVNTSMVEGIDEDLIVKPFHQKGAVVSIREFSNNASNHHHGMQPVERFGLDRTGTSDYDQDGVHDELTVGDMTAMTVWQAALGTPGQVIPNDPVVARAILRGERFFGMVGCADCHTPSMTLDSSVFSEPNPYNPPGNLQVSDVPEPYTFDMAVQGMLPRPEARYDGKLVIRPYTDLKRHNLCDEDLQHYCNEQLEQAGIPTEMFITRKLWDVGNSAPYGHRGDLTTLTEAIYHHGGEARDSREAFFALSQARQDEIIEFLKSLVMLPPGTPYLVVDENGNAKNKAALTKQLLNQ
ncbi:MAG: di-heme oxidoredictase family protein [Acidobacteriota bacterium]|nr:di-heme oxidoredictase family protein [Acidobacteriota bacterium]